MGPGLPRGRGINLGVDIGGTKILAVRAAGREVAHVVNAKTPKGGPAAVAERVGALVDKLDPDRAYESVGVVVPGVVAHGSVLAAPNLAGWSSPVPFGELLAATTGRAVRLGNDVNLATWAEYRLSPKPRVDNVLGVFVGTGVGGGLVLDGQLRKGPNGLAGELGHLTVEPGGAVCSCGGQGHLEAYLGRRCLEQRARDAADEGRSSALTEIAGQKRMTSGIWHAAVEANDPLALELLDDAARYLGQAIAMVRAMVDIDQVVLGGGFGSRLGGSWRSRVAQSVEHHRFGPTPVDIVASSIGDNAAALGAALLASDSL